MTQPCRLPTERRLSSASIWTCWSHARGQTAWPVSARNTQIETGRIYGSRNENQRAHDGPDDEYAYCRFERRHWRFRPSDLGRYLRGERDRARNRKSDHSAAYDSRPDEGPFDGAGNVGAEG